MCCPGCAAVAETISNEGLGAYYRQREGPARRAPGEPVDLPLEPFDAPELQGDFVRERNGSVHVVEMGCGTGAGAHHVCKNSLPLCTYESVDMQQTAILTCQRKFVPELDGRLANPNAEASSSPAYAWYFLAMAHQKEGNKVQAREYVNKANEWTDEVLTDKEHPPAWNRRATLEILRKEAESLVGTDDEVPEDSDQKPEPESSTKTQAGRDQDSD